MNRNEHYQNQKLQNSEWYQHQLEKARVQSKAITNLKETSPEEYERKRAMARERLLRYRNKGTLSSRALLRMRILEKLGGRCVNCGFNDVRALHIDHVNNGGREEARKFKGRGWSYYRHIENNLTTGEYQILCANCNTIKEFERSTKKEI